MSPIPETSTWQTWTANEKGLTGDALMNFINNELFPALKQLDITSSTQAKIIRSVSEDTHNYMKNDTHPSGDQSDQRHLFNNLYETILKDL